MQINYIHPLAKYRQVSAEYAPAHTGDLRYALDFDCPEGTAIRAAADGVVMLVKDDSNRGGVLDMQYYNDGNRIVIQHAHKECTAYEHLRYKGATCRLGQRVRQGDMIGYTGNTGYSSGPHLHFEVLINPKNKEFEGETVPIMFVDK